MIRGTVSGFQARFEQRPGGRMPLSVSVWNFRLERAASDGSPLPRVAVEMRGTSINGSIMNGDVVEVDVPAGTEGLVQASSVRNVTSGSTVTAHGGTESRASRVFGVAIGIFVALLFLFVFSMLAVGFLTG